jgi:hypothetical protein
MLAHMPNGVNWSFPIGIRKRQAEDLGVDFLDVSPANVAFLD